MLDRSAVGEVSSLSSRTTWQRLPAGDTLRSVSPRGNRCHFVLVDKDETSPTADLYNISLSQWSGLFDRWAVEHAAGLKNEILHRTNYFQCHCHKSHKMHLLVSISTNCLLDDRKQNSADRHGTRTIVKRCKFANNRFNINKGSI